MRLYLAGPIFGCTDFEIHAWRHRLKRKFDKRYNPESQFEVLDPMERDYAGRYDQNYEELVEWDIQRLRSSQFVICNAHKPSFGTPMELWDARLHGIPILLIRQPPINPWLRFVSTILVEDVTSAIDFLETLRP
jgi:hypothetical protein